MRPPCTRPVGLQLGPKAAPISVDAFIDVRSRELFTTWAQLRLLVAESKGRVRIDVHFGDVGTGELAAATVRHWLIAAASVGDLWGPMRLLAQVGSDRLAAMLSSRHTRAQLAKALGLQPKAHEAAFMSRCLVAQAQRDRIAATRRSGRNSGRARHPSFVVGERSFEDSPTLDRLRPEIAAYQRHKKNGRRTPWPRKLGGPRIMLRPPLQGAIVGGLGLRHRFLLIARSEDDPQLFVSLPPVLGYRTQHPGSLSVRVVSWGDSVGASELRHRLCAASVLGRELDYLRYLAIEPAARRDENPVTAELLASLDAVPERKCENQVDPVSLDLSDGAWLDGVRRTRGELESLRMLLPVLDAGRRPLSAILTHDEEAP